MVSSSEHPLNYYFYRQAVIPQICKCQASLNYKLRKLRTWNSFEFNLVNVVDNLTINLAKSRVSAQPAKPGSTTALTSDCILLSPME